MRFAHSGPLGPKPKTYQPRATPWVLDEERASPEGAAQIWLLGLALDGTHFSAKGCEVLAQVLRPRLVKILGEAKK